MTDEQRYIIANLAREGKTDREICKIVKLARCTVGKARREAGIKVNRDVKNRYKLSDEENQRRQACHDKGMSDYEIAETLGLTKQAISDWRSRKGLSPHIKGKQKKAPLVVPKPRKKNPAPKGAKCGTCRYFDPDELESETCKKCDHREMWARKERLA